MKEGFHGPIYATPPTIDLCGIILPDSGHLQEEDAAFTNKTKKSKHDPALPLYTSKEALRSLQCFKAAQVGETVALLLRTLFSFRACGSYPGVVHGRNLADHRRAHATAAVHRCSAVCKIIALLRARWCTPGPRRARPPTSW